MNKLIAKGRIFAAVFVFLLLFYSVYLANVSTSLTKSKSCDLSYELCEQAVFNQTVRAVFEQAPVTEEELYIRFEYGAPLVIEKAWVEGINMYMGITPVLFEEQKTEDLNREKQNRKPENHVRGLTFLGDCSLETMQWRLHAQIKNTATQEVAVLQFSFYTSRA